MKRNHSTKDLRTTFAYVSLGTRVSETLCSFAELAVGRVENSQAYLVTDHPKLWSSFPGTVVSYDSQNARDIIHRLKKQYPEKVLLQSGFWMATLERLFSLDSLREYVDPKAPVIHLESDVMSLLTRQQIDYLSTQYIRPAIPMESVTAGCASIIYSPSMDALSESLRGLEGILRDHRGWLTDMQLLARGVAAEVLEELPSTPVQALDVQKFSTQASESKSHKLIFDATAIGMYLFGADAMHTGGLVKPGFIQKDYALNISEFRWDLETIPSSTQTGLVAVSPSGERVFVSNVHVHSKINPGDPSANSSEWRDFIREANLKDWRRKILGPQPGDGGSSGGPERLRPRTYLLILFAKIRRSLFFERVAIRKALKNFRRRQ